MPWMALLPDVTAPSDRAAIELSQAKLNAAGKHKLLTVC